MPIVPSLLGDDQGLRIVAHCGEKLGVADPEGTLPALGERLGRNEVLYALADDRLDALDRSFLQGI